MSGRHVVRRVVTMLLMAAAAGTHAEDPGWRMIRPWPSGASLTCIAVGDEGAVAVGGGAVLVSSDALVWESAPAGAPELVAVAWGDGVFVGIAGDTVDSSLYSSSDGRVWVRRWTGRDLQLVDVAADAGRFLAVGASGAAVVSADGVGWAQVGTIECAPLVGVAGGGGRFVTAGDGLCSSTDGRAWTRGAGNFHPREKVDDVAWAASGFVAVSDTAGLLMSTDGVVWDTLADLPADYVNAVHAGGGDIVVAGGLPAEWPHRGSGWVAARDAAGGWSPVTHLDRSVADVVRVGDVWLAVGERGLQLASTLDAGWRVLDGGIVDSVYDAAFNGDTLVAVGGADVSIDEYIEQAAWRGSAGVSWTTTFFYREWYADHAPLDALVWTGDLWLAFGSADSSSTILASADGSSWERQPFDPPIFVSAAAHGGGRTVAVGSHREIPGAGAPVAFSDDGRTWQPVPAALPGRPRLNDVVFTGGRFVAVGMDGLTAFSDDGETWSAVVVDGGGAALDFRAVAWDGTRLAAVGSRFSPADGVRGVVAMSPDGAAWTVIDGVPASRLDEIGVIDGRFVAAADGDRLVGTSDGTSWTSWHLPSLGTVAAIVPIGDGGLAVGENGATAAWRPPGPPVATPEVWLPVASDTTGAGGGRWRTDMHVLNSTNDAVEIWLGAPGSQRRTVLPPRAQAALPDVVARTLLASDLSTPVVVTSAQPPIVTSRTFFDGPDGSYGQRIPGLLSEEATLGAGEVLLPGLAQDAAFRTNLGVTNLGDAPVVVRAVFHDRDGRLLGSRDLEVAARSWRQENRVLGPIAGRPVSGAWARLSALDADAAYVAYASVVDQVTSDPTFVLPVEASSEPVVVAAAAHVQGLLDTRWRSDVELVNPRDRAATVRLSLLPAQGGCPAPTPSVVTVSGRAALRIDDVLASALPCDGVGAIEIAPVEGAVAVTSRTYHTGGGGTYGQYVPAAGTTATLDPGSPGWLPGLRHDRDFRTNLGLVNLSERELVAAVALFAGDGTMLATLDVAVGPRSLRQLNGIIGDLRDREIGNACAAVTASGPGLHAWASVIDNRSGDPIFVPARHEPPPRPAHRD